MQLSLASTTATANAAVSLRRSSFPSSSSCFLVSHNSNATRVKMASSESPPHPPLPENRVVLGCGAASVDLLAAVAAYPNPDDKIRTTSLKVQGGGNAGNALTCASRLGLNPRLISKVADDSQGRGVLAELEADGVDTSFFVVAKEGNSPFTYVIVDNQTKTRTCIHTPGYPPMIPEDLSESSLTSALDGATLVYFDGRLYETALVIAQEATRKNIPILIDAERKREGLDELLHLATYVVCSAKFPQGLTRIRAEGIGTVNGRLFVGTAEKIPPEELVDTTGAGDAFIGAVLYAISANMPPEKMLPFAAQVAGAGCRGLGARTALPQRTDPRLLPFFQ
ncbi:KHK [Linum grandiflorum]